MYNLFSLTKLKFITLILLLIFLFSFSPQSPKSVALNIPFGGTIIGLIPSCNAFTGVLIFIKPPLSILPPTLMYMPGVSFSFPMGPPKNPKQHLLGVAETPISCVVGVCPYCTVVGGGPLILFHGSSAI